MGKISPHNKVYTRLGVSNIHGVGVFAIVDIPKNTLLFSGDKSKMVWINEKELELDNLPFEVKKLYYDFCVIINKGQFKIYGCPNSFDNITSSWYLNNSKEPNVYCDKASYDFYTLRDIKAGEELTVDYDTYSDE